MGGSSEPEVVGTAPTLSPKQEGLLNQNIDLVSKVLGRTNLDLNQNPSYQAAVQSAGTFLKPYDRTADAQVFDDTIAAPAVENFTQRTRPEMVAQGVYGTGTRNSSMLDLALADAQRSLTTDLSRLKTQSLADSYNSYLGRQLQGTSLAAQLSAMPTSTLLPYLQTSLGTTAQQPIIQPGQTGIGDMAMAGLAAAAPKGLLGGSLFGGKKGIFGGLF